MAPGGRLKIGRDDAGRAIVENFPATLPALFKTFCALNADNEAVVAGAERLTFAELDRISDYVAQGLVTRGIGKGDRVGIAMRNCPAWVVSHMAIVKAGAVATLLNGWWEAQEMEHAISLTDPKLINADGAGRCGLPRAAPAGTSSASRSSFRSRRPSPNSRMAMIRRRCPRSALKTTRRSCLRPARRVKQKARIHASRGDDGGLHLCDGPDGHARPADGGRPRARSPPRTLISVPLFHVTGEVPVMLNSFVVGRCMVMMSKWDAGEALRLIEREKVTYFVGVPTMSLELITHAESTNTTCRR